MAFEFKVPSMVCEGCVNTVKKAIATVDNRAQIDIVLETKAVTVETQAPVAEIHQAIANVGHTVA